MFVVSVSAPLAATAAAGHATSAAADRTKVLAAATNKSTSGKAARSAGSAKSAKATARSAGKHKAKSKKAKRHGKGGKRTTAAVKAEVPVLSEAELADSRDEHVASQIDGLLDAGYTPPTYVNDSGRAECVELVKGMLDAPRTAFWREGRPLAALKERVHHLAPGTAIATFFKGRYPQTGKRDRHAAIFLRAAEGGIWVLDQFVRQGEARERFIPWHHPRDKRPVNNAIAYSTIRW